MLGKLRHRAFRGGNDLLSEWDSVWQEPHPLRSSQSGEVGGGWAELSCPGVAFENPLRLKSCDTQDANGSFQAVGWTWTLAVD